MGKGLFVAVASAGAVLAVAVGLALAGTSGTPVVKTPGTEIFKVNKEGGDGVHFSPGVITVKSGGSVTFEKSDKGPEPHTVTIATKKSQLPTSFESPCKPCNVARGHLKNPKDTNSPIAHYVLDKGQPGFDTLGDSLALAPKGPHKKATVVISAPAGTTLYFMCAVHPWMQGTIHVT